VSQRLTTQAARLVPTATPVVSGALQRQCAACGNHTIAGGDCHGCSEKKKLGLQTKLTVGEIGDVYEQEADRIADQVLASAPPASEKGAPLRVQRFVDQQVGDSVPASVDSALAGPATPLEAALRQNMEHQFGHDFSRVRVYSGAHAEQSARDLHASAYTVGHDIVFGAGKSTRNDRHLIAHELTHVLQQTGGDGKIGKGTEQVRMSPNSRTGEGRLEHEADSVALKSLHAPASEPGLRDHVGASLGFDFSNVRLHRNVSNLETQGAHAVAAGADIYLAPGRYRPDLPLGRALLAHELTHVAQQSAAPRLPFGSGIFRNALAQTGAEHPSADLRERANTIRDSQTELTPAPRGMQQRCVAGCSSCSREQDSGTSQTTAPPAQQTTTSTPLPTHSVGPSQATAGNKVVRLAWTVDDGPTPLTPGMSTALSPRAATWFVMSNQLGAGTARTNSIAQLVTRQTAGDEIGIHSMHPTIPHAAWFPINLGAAVPKGYNTTALAMADLTSFTGELRTAGLKVHFGRMPGGELSEVKKYVEQAGGAASTSQTAARALLSGNTPPVGTPAAVITDVALVMSTLSTLNLHLWGGSATGPEVTSNTWEAESSGVPARTNDVVNRFTGVVDALASGSRTRPGSFIILAHDTTQADITQAGANISAMEQYAVSKGVRVEYYRMGDLYQIVRGTPP